MTTIPGLVGNGIVPSINDAAAVRCGPEYFVQLHVAEPGAGGMINLALVQFEIDAAAVNTRRRAVRFDHAASDPLFVPGTILIVSDRQMRWRCDRSEIYRFFTVWDASDWGDCLFFGNITANAVTPGDTFTISKGALKITQTLEGS